MLAASDASSVLIGIVTGAFAGLLAIIVAGSLHHPVEAPAIRDALQLVLARVFEGEAATGD